MSEDQTTRCIRIHARQDTLSIPVSAVKKFPFLQEHVARGSALVELDMSAIELMLMVENDLPSVDPDRQTQCRKMLGLHISVGKWVDVMDGSHNWCHAQIVDETAELVKVSFPGWSSQADIWVEKKSNRLRLFGSRGKLADRTKGFIPPPVGADIGRGRVWSDEHNFTNPLDWM